VDEALTHEVGLLSMMLANNETGVLQPVAAAAEQAHRASTWTHCDAVQAAGKVPVDFQALGVDLLTLSAHKLNGPKGVGALVVRGGVPVEPILYGGGQERGLRCGTENVAGIVGFGAAAELAGTELQTRMEAVRRLRAQLEEGLRGLAEVTLVAAEAERLPNTVLFTASGVEGGTLLMQLDRDGIAASGGSACDSHAEQPSHVLQAMGLEPGQARSAVRVSFGPRNTPREVDALLAILARVFERQRRVAASWA
jgi:cysteine desulfurase